MVLLSSVTHNLVLLSDLVLYLSSHNNLPFDVFVFSLSYIEQCFLSPLSLLQSVYRPEADNGVTFFETTEKSQVVVCFHKASFSLSWLVDAEEG